MARMSREFQLVLLGAGLLTAGSFLWPEDDPVMRANNAGDGKGGSSGRARPAHVFFFYTGGPGRRSTISSTSTIRGGFGRIGSFISGG